MANFDNYKSYCFILIYRIKEQIKKEKIFQNLPRWELKLSQRAENLEKMLNICKKVITREWKIYYHIFLAYKIY
jgi:hypothetical protein